MTDLPALTDRQMKRSAGSAIAGYLYQFERTVLELLSLNPGGKARVEGIEDVDLWNSHGASAIQIKYYADQSWSLAKIRKPVLEMLAAFASGQRIGYTLYIHLRDGPEPPERLTVEELKACLTHKPHHKPVARLYESFDDDTLASFIESFTIRTGVSLEEQRGLTISAIANALKCSDEEASGLHRMRAVAHLQEVATRAGAADRVISREQLIAFLDVREIYYAQWHREYVGLDNMLRSATQRLRRLGYNNANTYRGIALSLEESDLPAAVALALELSRDLIGSGRNRTRAAKPWTLLLSCPSEVAIALKRQLIGEGIAFNDGYEAIEFSPRHFTEPAVVNTRGGGDRLDRASYTLRVASELAIEPLERSGFQLAALLVIGDRQAWHTTMSKSEPAYVGGLSLGEMAHLLRKVTT